VEVAEEATPPVLVEREALVVLVVAVETEIIMVPLTQ
jgi:hypothetical protein